MFSHSCASFSARTTLWSKASLVLPSSSASFRALLVLTSTLSDILFLEQLVLLFVVRSRSLVHSLFHHFYVGLTTFSLSFPTTSFMYAPLFNAALGHLNIASPSLLLHLFFFSEPYLLFFHSSLHPPHISLCFHPLPLSLFSPSICLCNLFIGTPSRTCTRQIPEFHHYTNTCRRRPARYDWLQFCW